MFKHAIPGCKLAKVSLVNKQAHSQIIAEDTIITKLATDRVIAPQWHPYHTQLKVSAPRYEQWIDAAALDHGAAWSCPAQRCCYGALERHGLHRVAVLPKAYRNSHPHLKTNRRRCDRKMRIVLFRMKRACLQCLHKSKTRFTGCDRHPEGQLPQYCYRQHPLNAM